MIVQLRIEELARDMLRRYGASEPPFILFLGKACLRDATAQFGDVLKQGFLKDGPEGSEALARALDLAADWNDVLQKMARIFPGKALRRRVLSIYQRIPIPSFYQDLAVMIRQGCFREILTTNFDTLLEQALEATGMRRGADYRVVNLQRPEQTTSEDAPGVLLFKLNGDLGETVFNPDSIDAALKLVKRELRRDLVVVGYEGETDPINDWFAKNGGAVWWIAEKTSRTQKILSQIGSSRDLHVLEGRSAAPEWFFLHLFQLVVKSQLEFTDDPSLETSDTDRSTPKEIDLTTS